MGNLPIDAVQEFRTVSADPAASQGRSSGAQIELVTKSGTDVWHGSLREFHRNTITAANSFFNNKSGGKKPTLIRNQFGGNVGGPAIKNKLFFFFDYEGRRDASQVTLSRTVPLAHVYNGSLAYINNGAGCTPSSKINTTPSCITILTPAQVKALDPLGIGVSAAILGALTSRKYGIGDPSLGGDGINSGGIRFNSPSPRHENNYTGRVDFDPSSKHKLFGRFNIVRVNLPDNINAGAAGQQFPGDPVSNQIQVQDHSFVIGHTWIMSSNKINQATFGISKPIEFPEPVQTRVPERI